MASAFAKFKNQTYLEEAKTAADHYMADIGADEFFSTYELPMEAMACAGLATLAVGESAVMFADTASPSILKTLLNIKARAGCSRMTAPPTALGDAVAAHRKRDVSHRVVPAALVHDGVGVSWDTYFPLQPPHQPSQTALLLPQILGGTSSKWRCFFSSDATTGVALPSRPRLSGRAANLRGSGRDVRDVCRRDGGAHLAVDETVILLHLPLPLVGVPGHFE